MLPSLYGKHHVPSSHLYLLRDTMYKPANTYDARIPAISKGYCPFVSGQGYSAEVVRKDDDFFAGENTVRSILVVLTLVSRLTCRSARLGDSCVEGTDSVLASYIH